MSHTPGPWRYEFGETSGYDCMTAAFYVVGGDDRTGIRRVADVDCANYGQARCEPLDISAKENAESDARLISAAPDLLAACQIAVDLIEDYVQGRPEVAEQMRAAIAKAIIG